MVWFVIVCGNYIPVFVDYTLTSAKQQLKSDDKSKVDLVQEACAKYFSDQMLEFEIL